MTALAAFSALLGRLTGQTDLVVGSPVAGRTEAGIEDLLGFFVNTLALRADLSGDPSFRTLLGRVRESALSAYAHQDLPFERLVEELQPERDLSRSPLFQVVLGLDPARGGELVPGLRCELPWIDNGTAKFDLTLLLQEHEDGLTGGPGVRDRPLRSRHRGAARPCVPPPAFRSPGDGDGGAALRRCRCWERRSAGRSWANGTSGAGGLPSGACVHELVAAQIARTPETVALVYGRERITYGELGERAGRLSRRLAGLGVGPEVRVGVYLSRTPALVTTLLGILGAGGRLCAARPQLPAERLGFMLADARRGGDRHRAGARPRASRHPRRGC